MEFTELSAAEQAALVSLYKYGGAEDCRAGRSTVAAFELLTAKGLACKSDDETYITREGMRCVEGVG